MRPFHHCRAQQRIEHHGAVPPGHPDGRPEAAARELGEAEQDAAAGDEDGGLREGGAVDHGAHPSRCT
jgi:hypothetical protein